MNGLGRKLACLAAPVLLAVACGHPQTPAALAPQPAPDLVAKSNP
jgi:hypothetical protein